MSDWSEYELRYAAMEREYREYLDTVKQLNDMRERDEGARPPFPHCDSLVLHSPDSQCKYCNERVDLQLARIHFNVGFTNEADKFGVKRCPALVLRPHLNEKPWQGNVAMTPKMEQRIKETWQAFYKATGITPR